MYDVLELIVGVIVVVVFIVLCIICIPLFFIMLPAIIFVGALVGNKNIVDTEKHKPEATSDGAISHKDEQ